MRREFKELITEQEKKLKSAKGAKNKKGPASQFSRKAQNIGAQTGRMPSTNGTMSQLP